MTTSLLVGDRSFEVLRRLLFSTCELFVEQPQLLSRPYRVQSRVTAAEFGVFLEAISGRDLEIASENVEFLEILCAEFGFSDLQRKVEAFVSRTSAIDRVCRHEVSTLKERDMQHSRDILALEQKLADEVRRAVDAATAALRSESARQARKIDEQGRKISDLEDSKAQLERDVAALRDEMESMQARISRDLAAKSEPTAPTKSVEAGQKKPTLLGRRAKEFAPSESLLRWDNARPWQECPLRGIIAHLTQECGGNVHDRKVVSVTSNGVYGKAAVHSPAHAADLDTDSIFDSVCQQEAWLCYDFMGHEVTVTHYAIRSYSGITGGCNLRSWAVDASKDGGRWQEIDRQDNCDDLRAAGGIAIFLVAKPQSARMVRLRRTGFNHQGSLNFHISAFELFGKYE